MRRIPAYCVHKGRNLAYMTIDGREHYLGRAHSPESHARYREALSALLAGLAPAEAVRPDRKPSAMITTARIDRPGRVVAAESTSPATHESWILGHAKPDA